MDPTKNKVMYRGARDGKPTQIKGPSFFASVEIFAKTYGPTAAFKLTLRNPKVVTKAGWGEVADLEFQGPAAKKDYIAKLKAEGHDAVVANMGPVVVAFVVDPKTATLQESVTMNTVIAKLLDGHAAEDVLEGIDGTATHYAATMYRYGAKEKDAVKKSVKMIGHEPDDEMLSMSIDPLGNNKKSKLRHWMQHGHYDPTRAPLFLDASGNSIDD